MPRLVLASASPRRIELCRQAGLDVTVRPADVEEKPRAGEDPSFYVQRMACRKAEAVWRRARDGRPWTIGADTVVVTDARRILGKPRDRREACRMLRLLVGRTHHVLTGLCVARVGGPRRTCVVDTLVVFRESTDAEVEDYLATDEWRGKAGAYAVQGVAGACLVKSIVGSYTNVVGLPTAELIEMLRDLDVL